ncbi:craniofacial development protein 2-like [Palaemon carinicauda]|uniref:craniofacial development protein 2-like n=1 Tax=Palaemon carinicauda TaxID=392227 RepID=UPI0035B5A21D
MLMWRLLARPEEPRIYGVGFAIRSQMVQQHNLAPKAISECLMTVRIPITRDRHLTLISVYASTITSTDDDKAIFYTQLDRTIQAVLANDKLVVLGDFHARVGKDYRLCEGIIRRHGIGNCNANGQLLLGLCVEHKLVVTNTISQLPKRQKTTWRHLRSKHWHTLDYVLTRARGDVRTTRSMPGADDCWTEHRLLISRLSVTTLRPPRRAPDSEPHQRFDCSKLRNPQVAQNYKGACERHLAHPADAVGQATVEHQWTTFRNAMTRAAEETLANTIKKRQDWFDENDATISLFIETKRQAHLTLENQPTAAKKCAHKKKSCQSPSAAFDLPARP